MTTTAQQTLRRPSAAPARQPTGIPLSRLIRVELRKLVDTRAGRWLLLGIALVTVGAGVRCWVGNTPVNQPGLGIITTR